ncbi:carbohydrate ABC transporter permease [Nocardioidaceae bacterium SCSIO 66511]|nr:carbohydrate ABC transporter permease [Nocardioidaceae bacterium SCSIO 66511]
MTDTARPTARVRTRRRFTIGTLLQTIAVVIAVVVALAPVYWMVATSFKSASEVAQLHPTFWPKDFTLENYDKLVGESLPFMSFLVNSVVSSLVSAVLTIVISVLGGYSLSRGKYRLQGLMGYLVLIVRMLPLVVLVGPLYLLLLNAHLLNSIAGLVVGYTSFVVPFGVWMMKGFFDGVPKEVEEAARIDGYPRWQILFRVVLPLVWPGVFTTATFVFMESWNNLLYPLTFINTLENQTLPGGLLLSFTGQFKTDWGGMMAASCVTTLPLMIAFFAIQRSIVRGLTAGAVAGQ